MYNIHIMLCSTRKLRGDAAQQPLSRAVSEHDPWIFEPKRISAPPGRKESSSACTPLSSRDTRRILRVDILLASGLEPIRTMALQSSM